MYLDAVETNGSVAAPYIGKSTGETAYLAWVDWGPTHIDHHGAVCCEAAREWLTSYDLSLLNGASPLTGPRWLRQRFEWGPSVYPIHWCEALRKKSVDCGVHAALAHEVFEGRGVESFRVQMVQEFNSSAASQWKAKWVKGIARTDWLCGKLIYHEGCGIAAGDDRIKIWDPSAGWWLDPKTVEGYGSLRALRIFAESDSRPLQWGSHLIDANDWVELSVV